MTRRPDVLLPILLLLTGGLAVTTVVAAPPGVAATYVARWCADPGVTAPCVESATRDGVPLTEDDASVEVLVLDTQTTPDYDYTGVIVRSRASDGVLDPSDTYSLLLDVGALRPDYTEAYAGRPVVDRISDGDGTHHLRYTAHPVTTTAGCQDTYPDHCTDVATSSMTDLELEVQQLKTNLDFVGFDRSQNVDDVNGIFLETAADGSQYLESDWWNSRLDPTSAPVHGQARFRIPYVMLREDFGIPDPSTLTTGSMVGYVGSTPAAFDLEQDPAGGGVVVDISGVTFPHGDLRAGSTPAKVVKVKRGVITPTRPTFRRAERVSRTTAVLTVGRATPRGAQITGYRATCVSGDNTRVGTSRHTRIDVDGLVPGREYRCRVRATSRAGAGTASRTRTLAARPG